MRFLILSCNTGEGHNSAAKALKSYIEKMNNSCDIKDALSFWSPQKSKIISKGHVFVYRNLPLLFGKTYNFEENHPPKNGNESFIYELVIKGCESLREMFNSVSYDVVICTHVFSAMMITELKKQGDFKIPSYFISTDYTCCPGVSEIDMDGYVSPAEEINSEFIKAGKPTDRIITAGIPIKDSFYTKSDKKEAKRKLHLPTDKRLVLLMCGSMGCGPIKELAEKLPSCLPDDVHLTVICGNNRRLYRTLTKNGHPTNVTIIGYTTRMPLYMDAAELILTKPGGLSSTEAAAKHLPMIFIDAVPGCETKNLNYFVRHGFADTAEGTSDLCQLVNKYINNPILLEKMSENLKNNFSFCSSERIYNSICKEVENETV